MLVGGFGLTPLHHRAAPVNVQTNTELAYHLDLSFQRKETLLRFALLNELIAVLNHQFGAKPVPTQQLLKRTLKSVAISQTSRSRVQLHPRHQGAARKLT